MALKRKADGTYSVKTEAQAHDALVEMREINAKVKQLYIEHGILDLQEQAVQLKTAATDYAVAHDLETIPLGKDVYARLRRDKYGGTWVATDDDLDGAPADAQSLRSILKKKFPDQAKYREVWNRVTRRSIDVQKLDRAITEGVLTSEEVAPAFYEKDKKPFLILYGE